MFIWPGTCGFQVVPPCGGHLAPALLCGHAAVSSRAPVWGASAAEHFARDSDGRFKSCPRVGGIPRRQRNGRLLPSFKSCPRVGGIVNEGAENQRDPGFKSCPRVGGIVRSVVLSPLQQVSSRAPVWGASLLGLAGVVLIVGFKSCPRVGGILHSDGLLELDGRVSSRAPVWGASASPTRARPTCSFQVVPPCGGHQEVEEAKLERLKVSSRAPVWGASRPGSIWQSWATFQVVPPCGGHHEAALAQVLADGFKSCPRVGGIHDLLRLSFADCGFQVVPPCGGHL